MKRYMILLIGFLILFATSAVSSSSPRLEKVAESDYQWTGVAISKSGRIFVNYPTWNNHPNFKVAELINNISVPYPNEEENNKFICVQSIQTDDAGNLWILDPAKLRGQDIDVSGAKLFRINLTTNKIEKTFVFPSLVALPKSYLNDVRIDTKRNFAYITDSGLGGIIVLNLTSGESWRALTDIPEVQANLNTINFKSTGKLTRVSQSDGIELSGDGNTLYFSALGGDRLFAISTDVLRNVVLSVSQRQKKIQLLNEKNVPTDGILLKEDKLYMGDLPNETLWVFDLKVKQGHPLAFSEPIRWADSFALAPDGSIYFTTSEINYPLDQRKPYGLYRLVW